MSRARGPWLAVLGSIGLMLAVALPVDAASDSRAILLEVDATDVNRAIFRVRQTVPVSRAGRLVLLYPKWLPGYHAPAGPIDKLGGLTIKARGKELTWRRDPADVFAFEVDVPTGVDAIDLDFQFLSPAIPAQGRVVMTSEMLALEWPTVVLYPRGRVDRIQVMPSVKLPAGWSHATSLKVRNATDATIEFQPVSLEVLIDSPLYAGRNVRRVDLDSSGESAVWLNIFADRASQIDLPDDRISAYRKLVSQADLLFGARPFARYEFLVTLSDQLGGYGLEHRRSSENSISATHLLDWDRSVGSERVLLPHEYVHSWNAKFRRSTGLMTQEFHEPVSDTMLWMYEGLTEYWGWVLAVRSGLRSQQQTFEALATLAAFAEHRAGRQWRNLADTTSDPLIGRNAPLPWPSWQRGGDYYPEGPLLWLDVDTKIRELSGSKRSLDDFARLFFGMATPARPTLPYTFDAVIAALNEVQPYDWVGLLRRRIDGHEVPLDGLERGGWRLTYDKTQSSFDAAVEGQSGTVDCMYSLGFVVGRDGVLQEVAWGGPAFDAGLSIGTRLVAVNDVAYDGDALKRAIDAATGGVRAIRLLVQKGDRYRTVEIRYGGGLRYPHLERIEGATDHLGAIFTARERS
jgi:predicted metalloprotease with PDZ domain